MERTDAALLLSLRLEQVLGWPFCITELSRSSKWEAAAAAAAVAKASTVGAQKSSTPFRFPLLVTVVQWMQNITVKFPIEWYTPSS